MFRATIALARTGRALLAVLAAAFYSCESSSRDPRLEPPEPPAPLSPLATLATPTPVCKAEEIPVAVSLEGTGNLMAEYEEQAVFGAKPSAEGLLLDIYWTAAGLELTTEKMGAYYDIDAMTFGLDWIPVEWYSDPEPPYSRARLETPDEPGWGAIFFVSEFDDLWSYGWGAALSIVEHGKKRMENEAQFLAHPGYHVDAIDYNAWWYAEEPDERVTSAGLGHYCFMPPAEAPTTIELLFSTTPGSDPGSGAKLRIASARIDHWQVSDVRVDNGPEGWDTADIVALAFDRAHGVLMYSLDRGVEPFYVAKAVMDTDDAGAIFLRFDEEALPLRDPRGELMSGVIGPRVKGGCGNDPRLLRYSGK
ncbi:MAG: hypothetical protein GY711_23995 [bacterium]|nr:hypothetical protein [bacterium]